MNSQDPRLNDHLRGMLKIFSQMFTPHFFTNAIFVFTRYSFDDKLEKKRTHGAEKSKEDIIKEMICVMNSEFSIHLNSE